MFDSRLCDFLISILDSHKRGHEIMITTIEEIDYSNSLMISNHLKHLMREGLIIKDEKGYVRRPIA